jgi:predicted AAA+ superfamily ATPase
MAHIKRHIKNRLLKALEISPIVFLNGPRQASKSTLVQAIAKKHIAEYVTFDSTTQMAAVASTPENHLLEKP